MLPDDYFGNTNIHWLGVVEDRMDPLGLNRVRVRIYRYHPADQSLLNTGDLPWALVLMPTTTGGVSGVGATPHGLVEGSWVYGTFLDGEDAQQPLVIGTILGRSRLSFDDPCGITNSGGSFSTDELYQGGSVPPINVPGNNNRERSYKFFIQNGYTPEQASGIVGNLMAESTVNIDPTINEIGGGGGYGIAQWTYPPRKRGLHNFARSHGYDVATLETQLLYIQHELNTEEAAWNAKLKASTTPEQAAMAFCGFERPYIYKNGRCDPTTPEAKKRMGYARNTFEIYGKGSSGTQSNVPQTNYNPSTLTEPVEGVVQAVDYNNTSNPCINPNLLDSAPAFQSETAGLQIDTVRVGSTMTERDIRVLGDQINQQGSYLIRKDGSVERLGGAKSPLVIILEGGSSGYAGSITNKNGDGSTYYTIAQRMTLERMLKDLKLRNPNLKIEEIGAIGFDPSIIGV